MHLAETGYYWCLVEAQISHHPVMYSPRLFQEVTLDTQSLCCVPFTKKAGFQGLRLWA